MKTRDKIFYKVWKIDMNKFKPIWGLMLGILLLEVDRPWVAGLTLWRLEAHEDVKMLALYGGPKGGLQSVNVNRPSHVTCIVR